MIESIELRIGNSVMHFDKVIEVTQILPLWIESNYSPFGYIEYEKLDAIPLTEDWLLKMGFILDKGVGVWFPSFNTNRSFAIWTAYSDIPFKLCMDDNNHIIINNIHQLQNLFFALTGQELITS